MKKCVKCGQEMHTPASVCPKTAGGSCVYSDEQRVKDTTPSEKAMEIAKTIPFGCGCCSYYSEDFITKWIAVEIDAAIAEAGK